jgi:DNA-binding CsgD family transcriptional regulator
MQLTREKKCQIAALGAKGKTVEEIAQTAGLEVETVREFLSARSSEKTDDMPKSDKKAYAIRLFHEGKTRKEIIELTGMSRSMVYALLPATKGERKGQGAGRPKKKPAQINVDFDKAADEMIAEAETKKEPAPAATDTDSVIKDNIDILYPNDSTDEPKSQEPEPEMCPEWLLATTEDMLFIYNSMTEAEQRAWDLGQIYGRIAHERARYV